MEEIGQKVSSPEIIVHHKPKSTLAEGFRSLRTAVLFSSPDTPLKTILISSFIPKEGKTFITANLALVIAYSGESVLLVDADMRKPQIHKVFGLENRRGLSNVIVGEEPNIHRSVLHEKLDIMTCGPIPPNPAELLGSKRMAEFIGQMKGTYDKVILDSPPISSVTDAVVLSKLMDSVVYVVHGGATTREAAQHGSRVMRDVDAKVIGAVLNNIDIGRESYYYSHYYHYYYHYYDYYGHDGEKTRKRHEWDRPKKGFFAGLFRNKRNKQPDQQA
jgi:capsular exopolysaccharide synthesis family protein